MLGLPADPHDIPQYFPDGSYTYGLGYIRSADRRQAIARTDIPSAAARRQRYELPALEGPFARVLARFGTALPLPVAPLPLCLLPQSRRPRTTSPAAPPPTPSWRS